MSRHLIWVLAALLVVPAGTAAAATCEHGAQKPESQSQGQSHQSKLWWIDPQYRSDLGITDQQSVSIDQVWQKSVPKLREAREKLEKLEAGLSQMIRENTAEEAVVKAEIEKVESSRADYNMKRSFMIYRMNKVLTAEQRAKVKALYDQRNGGRR